MGLNFGGDWADIALRFTAFTNGVTSCIVGATKPDQLEQNAAASGIKLSEEIIRRIEDVMR